MGERWPLRAGGPIILDGHEPLDPTATAVTDHHDVLHLSKTPSTVQLVDLAIINDFF